MTPRSGLVPVERASMMNRTTKMKPCTKVPADAAQPLKVSGRTSPKSFALVNPESLSDQENAELSLCENTIRNGLETIAKRFVEVGLA
jgi:hypothetical protein